MNTPTKAYSPLIEKAARMAIVAHQEQTRKDDNFPYIVHPFMVATILLRYRFSDEVVAASLVHDVVEDARVSIHTIRDELGDTIATIVAGVSEEDKSTFRWEDRKKAYIENIRRGSEEVKAVSLADKIHNLSNMVAAYHTQGEDFWKKFSRGKAEQLWFAKSMLLMFQETWDHPMIDEYAALVKRLQE